MYGLNIFYKYTYGMKVNILSPFIKYNTIIQWEYYKISGLLFRGILLKCVISKQREANFSFTGHRLVMKCYAIMK